MKEGACSSETLVTTYQTIWRHCQDDHIVNPPVLPLHQCKQQSQVLNTRNACNGKEPVALTKCQHSCSQRQVSGYRNYADVSESYLQLVAQQNTFLTHANLLICALGLGLAEVRHSTCGGNTNCVKYKHHCKRVSHCRTTYLLIVLLFPLVHNINTLKTCKIV